MNAPAGHGNVGEGVSGPSVHGLNISYAGGNAQLNIPELKDAARHS
jgi:hypothetical protein